MQVLSVNFLFFFRQLQPYRTQALARWFAKHQPERLKRKLTEQCYTPSKRKCKEACSEESAQ